jgi:hypothetical protein
MSADMERLLQKAAAASAAATARVGHPGAGGSVIASGGHGAGEPLEPAIRRTGMMTKCDPRGRNWTRRCFVLRGTDLEYYKCTVDGDWANGEQKGVVDLSAASLMQTKNKGRAGYQICVELVAEDKSRAPHASPPATPHPTIAYSTAVCLSAVLRWGRRPVQVSLRSVGGVRRMAGRCRPPPRHPHAPCPPAPPRWGGCKARHHLRTLVPRTAALGTSWHGFG